MSRRPIRLRDWCLYRDTADDGEIEIVCVVEGSYDPPCRGNRYGHPDTWEDDSGGESEIEAVLCDGRDMEPHLSDAEREAIREAIRLEWEDQDEDRDAPAWAGDER